MRFFRNEGTLSVLFDGIALVFLLPFAHGHRADTTESALWNGWSDGLGGFGQHLAMTISFMSLVGVH